MSKLFFISLYLKLAIPKRRIIFLILPFFPLLYYFLLSVTLCLLLGILLFIGHSIPYASIQFTYYHWQGTRWLYMKSQDFLSNNCCL